MGTMQFAESRQDGAAILAERALHPLDAPPGARQALRGAEASLPDARAWNDLLGAPVLGAQELSALNAIARPRFVPQGGVVFALHEAARALVFVREGDAALGCATQDGTFRIERPVHGPGWLDQSSAWIDAAHPVEARAMSPLAVVELPREDVQALMLTQPLLARRLVTGLAREVHALALCTHGLMHKDAPARFAQWLVARFQPSAESTCCGIVKMGERKRDIASQLAITPETLSRLMRSFSRQGLLSVTGYTVHVADVEGLRRIAEGG